MNEILDRPDVTAAWMELERLRSICRWPAVVRDVQPARHQGDVDVEQRFGYWI